MVRSSQIPTQGCTVAPRLPARPRRDLFRPRFATDPRLTSPQNPLVVVAYRPFERSLCDQLADRVDMQR
ncbi:unnamed protein product [Parajaminaea phylloscopi]